MTPSLSRGKGDATTGASSHSCSDFYRMEQMYPDETIPTATTTARAAATAAVASARGGGSIDQDEVGNVSSPDPPQGLHEQPHPQSVVHPKPGDDSVDSRSLAPPQHSSSTAFHGKVNRVRLLRDYFLVSLFPHPFVV